MTYDLRDDYVRMGYGEDEVAEFDSVETIDAIESALIGLGHTTDRIGNIRSLSARLSDGSRWDLVFNIAEGLLGFGREAQVPALLDAFQIPYTFSDALLTALTLHKAMTKRVVRDMGVPTADFALVEEPADAAGVALTFPLFVKPVAGGTSVGISAASLVDDRARLAEVCEELLDKYRQPVLVEAYLPGRELTVGVIGTGKAARALGAMEVFFLEDAEPGGYSYRNKARYQSSVRYALADDRVAREAMELAVRTWTLLGCRDAGRVDFRCDGQGNVHFMEVNPLAGLHPVHSDLVILCRLKGIAYEELIEEILCSALARLGKGGGR